MAILGRSYGVYNLHRPVVVGAGVVFAPVKTHLAPSFRKVGVGVLRGPVVVFGPGAIQYGPTVSLATTKYGKAKPNLSPPAVVGAGIVSRKLQVELAYSRRGAPKPRLSPPIVVGDGIAFNGPSVRLVAPANTRNPVRHVLAPPTVLAVPFVAAPVSTAFAYSLRGRPKSQLRPPAVTGDGVAFGGPSVRIVAPINSRQIVRYRLSPPIIPTVVVALAPPLGLHIARTPPRRTRSVLHLPSAVGPPTTFHGPGVRLVAPANSRRPVRHILSAPAVVVSISPLAPLVVKLAYSRRGIAKVRLSPPRAIGGGIAFFGPGVKLVAPINRRAQVRHLLSPPAVVISNAPFAPVKASLAYSRRGKARYRLAAPSVVGSSTTFHGPGVRLVAPNNSRALVRHRLSPPAVVVSNAPFAPVSSHLAYSRRGRPRYRLSAPSVVGAAVTFRGPGVRLVAPQNARQAVSHALRAPTVVTAAPFTIKAISSLVRSSRPIVARHRFIIPTVVGGSITFYGPGVRLTSPANRRNPVVSRLAPPQVVTPAPVSYPTKQHLAASRRGVTRYRLAAPVAVGGSIVFHGPGTRLVAPINARQLVGHKLATPVVVIPAPPVVSTLRVVLARSQRGRVRSFIGHPVAAAAVAFYGPGVRLVNPKNNRQLVRHVLAAPVVVADGVAFSGPSVTTVRILPQKTIMRLTAPPVVSTAAFHGPGVRLVTPLNTRQRVGSRLAPPTAVIAAALARPLDTTLAPQRRGVVSSSLAGPTTVTAAITFHGPGVKLAASSRGKARSILSAPAVVTPLVFVVYAPIKSVRAHSLRGRPFSVLHAPIVVASGIAFGGPRVRLTAPASGSRLLFSTLSAPVVVGTFVAFVASPIKIGLAYSRRGKGLARLSKPAVVGAGIVFRPLDSTLVRILPPKRFWKLAPPAVVQAIGVEFFGPVTRLSPAKRGLPKSRLSTPAVVGAGIVFAPIKLTLAYSRRGEPKVHLYAPVVVAVGAVYYGPRTHLAYSKRGVAKSQLLAPTAVAAGVSFRGARVMLAPSQRGVAKPRLYVPTVVAAGTAFFGPQVVTTYSKRGATRSRLSAPAVVGAGIIFRPVSATVARIKPPQRFWHLSPPAVVQPIGVEFFGPKSHLAYSLHGTPKSRLYAPAAVGGGIYFRPVQIRLTYSRRGIAKSRLFVPVIPSLAPPIRVTVVRIRPVSVHSHLPSRFAYVAFAPVRVQLAYSLRGKPKSFITLPEIGADFRARPLRTTLASSHRFRYVTSQLSTPTAVLRPHARPIVTRMQAVGMRRYKPPTHPKLFPPTTRPPSAQQFYLTAGTPSSFWCSGKPSCDFTIDIPAAWCVGKPETDFAPDPPDDDWCVGKPV